MQHAFQQNMMLQNHLHECPTQKLKSWPPTTCILEHSALLRKKKFCIFFLNSQPQFQQDHKSLQANLIALHLTYSIDVSTLQIFMPTKKILMNLGVWGHPNFVPFPSRHI